MPDTTKHMKEAAKQKQYRCSHCKQWKNGDCFWAVSGTRGKDYWCVECRRTYSQNLSFKLRRRSIEREWRGRNSEKIQAQAIVRGLLRKGVLAKQTCFLCGESKTQGHHIDYSFPKKVIWLCVKHHAKVHRREKHFRILSTKQV